MHTKERELKKTTYTQLTWGTVKYRSFTVKMGLP